MAQSVGDFLLERLRLWGVQRVFGYPGDGINGIVGAFGRAKNEPEFVQVRHEEMAAFMACAHAKFTGETGVCLATSGPGAIHLLNGLYDAKADHQPVVAIVGQQKRASLGGDFQQEVDLHALFKDVAHEYVQEIMTPAQARHVIDRAFRIAHDQRTVTCIIVPNDVQDLPAVAVPPRVHGSVRSGPIVGGVRRAPRHVVPSEDELDRAAEVLNAGQRVAMLVGAGALGAGARVIDVANRLEAGVAKALLGKAVIPDTLPWVTGAIGLLGTEPSWELMNECDTLLMIGSAFPYAEFLPEEGQARGVQIDIDARMLSLRYPMEVAMVGDARATLDALLPRLHVRQNDDWRQRVQARVARWWRVMDRRAASDAKPINPQRVFRELSQQLPDNAIVTADSGTAANWYARDVQLREGMMGSLSGGLASMGAAMPYALAAKMAHPSRVVVALEGDGAMQMNGINELITLSNLWQTWRDPRLAVLVLNNGDLNEVTWEQRAQEGDPRFAVSQSLPPFDYAAYARQLGLNGIRVEAPGDVRAAWREAFEADRPTVLDVVTDPNVPPIPPHMTAKMFRNYTGALLRGDSEAAGVARATMRETWESVASRWEK
ncbi:thiamine pyrophosphate-requiring protein [Pandoraea nosoerga]|uniref:Thiamine pyrophosphate-requiring protein n=1 Tax=Pandoraea nosoerga TaxID=2508296 RepID=A0A5E4SSM7_9BURK|nr:thiamine pyrophosphate-requiring protein [Pandoraea nosoerga]MBN4665212.1 thiamine pyrophosphate-requiring protein [Pandoraea nosoerga]MBN4674613.1 thiamine pyrophosphate-requiring protein [Pandoraea nosoerga]MBN4680501.1 thiamine pyrophosphate-requiring protein [Pandoraea nosoerga]MBN4743906.1 thiamine pyrophosphate-requiring protein [Pandoraea nosoerga]VVD76849.1 thiamine pyrophosphate-requiring protein [Pandoraea nosoerga]